MIPIIHQNLNSLALGQRSPDEDRTDAASFLAALEAQDESSSSSVDAISADGCFMGGIVVPAQPTVITQPVLRPSTVNQADSFLTVIPILSKQPIAVPCAGLTPSEPSSAPIDQPDMSTSSVGPLVHNPEHQAPSVTVGAVDLPTVSATKPELPHAAAKFTHTIPGTKRPHDALPAELIMQPVGDPGPTPAASPQNGRSLALGAMPAPAVVIGGASSPASALDSHGVAAEVVVPVQTTVQPLDRSAKTEDATTTPSPLRTQVSAPQLQVFQPHGSPNQFHEDLLTSQQVLPLAIEPARSQPKLPLADQTLSDQTTGEQTQDASLNAAPEQLKPSVSPAKSAWQTRLQSAVPMSSHPEQSVQLFQARGDAVSPAAYSANSPNPSPAPHSIGLRTFIPLSSIKNVASIPQAVENANPPQPDSASAAASGVSPSATSTSYTMPKPKFDAAATNNPGTADLVQTTLQLAPDQVDQQAKPTSALPISSYQTVQLHGFPPSLASSVPARLLNHTAAAQTGGVDVLLQPEELGCVKFQIQHHGETISILLSAERPEALDLLRRHSDQLLQELRQSGFLQASLNFGQWGQQQKSQAPPSDLVAVFDVEGVEAPSTPRHLPSPAAGPAERGLNLRL